MEIIKLNEKMTRQFHVNNGRKANQAIWKEGRQIKIEGRQIKIYFCKGKNQIRIYISTNKKGNHYYNGNESMKM